MVMMMRSMTLMIMEMSFTVPRRMMTMKITTVHLISLKMTTTVKT